MKPLFMARAGLALAATALGARAEVSPLPPIPDKPKAVLMVNGPEPWREYQIRAREADKIVDRLQRCLAYPDLPDNRWPAGHAEAHCRYHAIETIGLPEVDGYLDRGDLKGLDAQIDGYLAKHFSKEHAGEDIHTFFDKFGIVSAEVGRITQRWLDAAPKSAYALLARATFLRVSATEARGNDVIARTPSEKLQRMEDLIEQAIPLYRDAIAKNPKLMPAYPGLLNIAMLNSRADLETEAIAGARAHDPGCVDMAGMRMQSLQPRWGGSYEAMLAFARELDAYIEKRPHLAIHTAAPFGDRGDMLLNEGVYTRETNDVLTMAISIGTSEDYLIDAARLALSPSDGSPDTWRAVSYLLQSQRFSSGTAWSNGTIARYVGVSEPEWALPYAQRATEIEPSNGLWHFQFGSVLHRAGRLPQAIQEWSIAANDARYRQRSLSALAMAQLHTEDLPEKDRVAAAKPHIDRLIAEYPNDGRGWLMRIQSHELLGKSADIEIIQRFLKVANPDDSYQRQAYDRLQAATKAASAEK